MAQPAAVPSVGTPRSSVATAPAVVTLASVPVGTRGLLVRAGEAATPVQRRLAEHGLRPGAQVVAGHRTAGGGRVIEVAGARIALGRELLAGIEIEPA